jgi:hypothetical protein
VSSVHEQAGTKNRWPTVRRDVPGDGAGGGDRLSGGRGSFACGFKNNTFDDVISLTAQLGISVFFQ